MRAISITEKQARPAKRHAVYDGRDRLGDVEQHDIGFAAHDRLGRDLGHFDTEAAAIDAIAKAAGGAS